MELIDSRTSVVGGRLYCWAIGHVFHVAVFFGLLLYVPFRSINYDLNGIADAQAVETAGIHVFPPNHMLYNPLGVVLYHAAQWLGYDGRAIVLLQMLTALCGALGLGFGFLAFRHMTGDPIAAFASSLWLGTSWAYWTFSTDVAYIVPSAMVVMAALALLFGGPLSKRRLAALAGISALAILTWQANVLLLPILALLVLATRDELMRSDRLRAVGILSGVMIGLTGLVYLVVGVLVYGVRGPSELLRWALNYGGVHLPMWGRLGFDRLLPLATSALASLVPVWDGLGLRDIVQGSFDTSKIPAQLSLAAMVILAGWSAVWIIRDRSSERRRGSALPWLLAAYALYVLFALWWDPHEPKWFVVPNVFLAAILATVFACSGKERHGYPIYVACLVVIAAGNFSAQIWPRHAQPNLNLQTAQCVASHSASNDLIIMADWTWEGYEQYFYSRNTLNLIGLFGTMSKSDGLLFLTQNITSTQQRQGNVYAVDLSSYSPGYLSWFFSQTSLSPRDFDQFASTPAFSCGDVQFRKLALR